MLIDPKYAPALPEDSVIDAASGYNANVPATQQGYPLWWRVQPELYTSLLSTRERYGIRVDDGIAEYEAQLKDSENTHGSQ